MTFDKTKAMRSAERYLSQGKIRAAIGEYKVIVENDSKDFNTLNMLGDLYVKNKEKAEAVVCFTRVAEHYGKQGFSQKAIAIYNKISRLEPESAEVSQRLAELYQAKGSIAEARTHYVALADHFQRGGKKIEALSVWKQIAELDPNNSEVYIKIAESYWQENQKDEAAEAFTIAGTRLSAQGKHEAALTAFSRALEIHHHDFNALNGFVKAQINLGYADEAAKTLESILEQQPYNRDILYLLADCHLDTDNPESAECAIVKLVEQEPANYPKFLDLVKSYLKINDLDAAARVLAISSENLLVGGQSDDFLGLTDEILTRNPEHLAALRLLIRYYGWNRDEAELKNTLERLAESANLAESDEDEKSALAQLVMLVPNEARYASRLQELNYDYAPPAVEFAEMDALPEFPETENVQTDGYGEYSSEFAFVTEPSITYENIDSGDAGKDFAFSESIPDYNGETAGQTFAGGQVEDFESGVSGELSTGEQLRLEKEIESIRFYIEQGYQELAEKSLRDLETEFGSRPEINELQIQIGGAATEQSPIEFSKEAFLTDHQNSANGNELYVSGVTEIEAEAEQFGLSQEFIEEISAAVDEPDASADEKPKNDFFDDFRSGLGLEESETSAAVADYETHFQMAVAYSEMGLADEAIREFQDAINLVSADDGTRRFFQCAHLLGNCFMEKRMPHLALLWYRRALETSNLKTEEKQGIWYEIGSVYQAQEDAKNALEYFEKIYAVDVDYRDIKNRVESLLVSG